jgi:hypothetical protein
VVVPPIILAVTMGPALWSTEVDFTVCPTVADDKAL